MCVVRSIESFAEKVAKMSQANENQVATVRGEDDVIWRFLLDWQSNLGTLSMSRRIPVLFVRAVAEFRVHGGEDLLGVRRYARQIKRPVVRFTIVLFENSVLRGARDGRRERKGGRRGGRSILGSGACICLGDGGEVGGSRRHGGKGG